MEAEDDRTVFIERIPFGIGQDDLLQSLLHGTMDAIIRSSMGDDLTTFSAVYSSRAMAEDAVFVAQAALSTTPGLETMCVRLKCDLILRAQAELIETRQRVRDILESDRMIFIRRLSPTSHCFGVHRFFLDYGALDGLPCIYRNPRTGEIMGVVRFQSKGVCEAALQQLYSTGRPIELDGAEIHIEPYKSRAILAAAAAKRGNHIDCIKSASSYEEMAVQLIERQNTIIIGSMRNTIHFCLFSAMLCQICSDDVPARKISLNRIRLLDVSFEETRECRFIAALADAVQNRDVSLLINLVIEFNLVAPLAYWKICLLRDLLRKIALVVNT